MELLHPLGRDELALTGRDPAAAVERGEITRIRHGRYVDADAWDGAFSEARELALARAAVAATLGGAVLSHTTAAAVWGLPLFRHRPDRAHVIVRRRTSGSSTGSLIRHRDRWDGEVQVLDGMPVTTLPRTVYDVMRSASIETAVCCADAALRSVAVREGSREVDLGRAEELRADIAEILARSSGKRGVKQARLVLAFADPRAESPGESVSRLYLDRMGFRDIRLQVAVASWAERPFEIDLEFAGVLGEFDGQAKYALRGGDVAEAVRAEKRREDWIRARTGRRMVRWGMPEIRSYETFRGFLTGLGIRP
ncbi:hypothetical protein [Microbacterium sp. gxy059]|uniref:hypothetical protein n=1 Tax=Microbacterium sp. gxy059 TaxID=2957199 RepID=UPI003D994CF7